MLRILTGRSGSGKTHEMLAEICRNRRAGTVLIVPEQYSHDTERKLCAFGGEDISLTCEVLSFSRLCTRVFAQAGGLAAEFLDEGGKLLTMYRAVDAVRPHLSYFKKPSERAEFISGIADAITEFKTYCVTPADLERTAGETDGTLSKKLADLSLIYEAYRALEARTGLDSAGRLDLLADKLAECDFAEGKDFYIDCFSDFSGLEWKVLEEIIESARSVTVALTCDSDSVFDLQRETVGKLRAMAGKLGVKVRLTEYERREDRPPALDYIERFLLSYDAGPFEGEADEVKLVIAPSRQMEIEWAAGKVLELVRDNGLRFRDIAVVADSFDDYARPLIAVFENYGIPLFLSAGTDIVEKPALLAVTSAVSAVTGGFAYDEMFKYLKTGLAGITFEECDMLENYVLMWNIRGSLWTREQDWTFNPAGFGRDFSDSEANILYTLNSLRNKVIQPLRNLQSALKSAKNGAEMTLGVYAFVEEINLADKLYNKVARLTELGYPKQAEEYGSLWDILCGVLEQCYAALGDTVLSPEQFGKLLCMTLSAYDVDTIPVSLDCVTAGEIDRMRHRRTKCLIVMGATSEAFSSLPTGIITETERSELIGLGMSLAPTAYTRLEQKLGIIYSLVSSAESRLFFTYPEADESGYELRPLFIISRLRNLIPQMEILRAGEDSASNAPAPSLELAACGEGELPDALRAYFSDDEVYINICAAGQPTDGDLTHESVESLYGVMPSLSATRVDKFNSCKFAYYMQFGLKARARSKADFAAPEYGTFVHYILENVSLEIMERGVGFRNIDRDELRGLVEKYTRIYVSDVLYGGLDDKTARFKYLFKRLEGTIFEVVKSAFDELDHSEFEPAALELGFGSTGKIPAVEAGDQGEQVRITGFVDRVDVCIHNGKPYIRVVDYKTGVKSFSFTDIRYGMGIQMLLYLFALSKSNGGAVPAGVLYFPARDAVLNAPRDISDEELESKRQSSLKRYGLLLDDPEILRKMEDFGDGKPKYLPVKLTKDGITGEGLASLQQLGKLSRHVDNVLATIGKELSGGKYAPDPYTHGANSACKYCDFTGACGYDETSGKKRYLKTYDNAAFWSWLEEVDYERV